MATAETFPNGAEVKQSAIDLRAVAPSAKPALEPLAVGAKDLARLLGISVATLWRWDASGELGPTGIKKLGRRLWPLAEVREWVLEKMPARKLWNALAAQRYGRPV